MNHLPPEAREELPPLPEWSLRASAELHKYARAALAQRPAGLPPLPPEECSEWLLNGKRINAFAHPSGPVQPYFSEKGYESAPLYTQSQMREYARAALAQPAGDQGAELQWLAEFEQFVSKWVQSESKQRDLMALARRRLTASPVGQGAEAGLLGYTRLENILQLRSGSCEMVVYLRPTGTYTTPLYAALAVDPAGAQEDARRYRWLMGDPDSATGRWGRAVRMWDGSDGPVGLQRAIDALMAPKEQPK